MAEYLCPVCGEECCTLYADKYGEVFACEECLQSVDAEDYFEREAEEERICMEEQKARDRWCN